MKQDLIHLNRAEEIAYGVRIGGADGEKPVLGLLESPQGLFSEVDRDVYKITKNIRANTADQTDITNIQATVFAFFGFFLCSQKKNSIMGITSRPILPFWVEEANSSGIMGQF